jgi:hypothetical protein
LAVEQRYRALGEALQEEITHYRVNLPYREAAK